MLNRLRTRLRTRLRSWLGLEHFETLLLDELRQQSTRVSRNEEERDRLDRHLSDTRMGQSRTATSLISVRREVEELGLMLRTLASSLGPLWTTATGHTLPITMLSDTHLDAIMRNGFGGRRVREAIEREQERRAEDDRWATRQGKGSPRQRLAKVEEQLHALRGFMPPGMVRHRGTETGRVTYSKPCAVELTDDSDAGRFSDGEREALLATIARNLEQVHAMLRQERTDLDEANRRIRKQTARINALEEELER